MRVHWKGLLITGAVAALVIWQWQVLWPLFTSLLVSIILAYLINLAVKPMERHMPRSAALLIVSLLSTGLVVLALSFALPRAVNEARLLIAQLPHYLETIGSLMVRAQQNLYSMGIDLPIDALKLRLNDWLAGVGNQPPQLGGWPNFIKYLPSLALAPVLAIYFVKDREYFAEQVLSAVPFKYRSDVRRFGWEMDRVLGQFLRGQLSIAVMVGLMAMLGLWLVGVPYFWLLAVLTGLLNMIPYFGPILAMVPVAFAALPGGVGQVLLGLGVCMLIQQIDGNFLTPKVMGDTLGIHPVTLMLSLILFGGMFGIVGLLLAVPILLFARTLATMLFAARVREQSKQQASEPQTDPIQE